jgi:hypothetical protein
MPLDIGHLITALTAAFFVIASYVILFSAFLPPSGVYVRTQFFYKNVSSAYMKRPKYQALDVLAQDTHYKYFALFIIPMGAYFVIANWVGWQYYQNS